MDNAHISLHLPVATKARWVRESRSEGKRLTDWIIEKVESTMDENENIVWLENVAGLFRVVGADDARHAKAIVADLGYWPTSMTKRIDERHERRPSIYTEVQVGPPLKVTVVGEHLLGMAR